MIKSFKVQENQAVGVAVEENMSNLTSASNEACASSVTRNDSGGMLPQHYNFVAPIQNQPQPQKKKRNLPGNPDPESEVIALSPKTLMATNRFLCEICNKGFQRDQNLQLHRRGHNLPWKLKQRTNKEVIRKKVYVCPEVSCVHHEPSRALGDLTGIKKHFCRKHGEKKWKCDKCSKRYAVQSDWKAHSKTCGTREYRCDCGTLFSRRDSFITHRAFCDALAEESTRAITGNPLLPSGIAAGSSSSSQHFQFTSSQHDDHLQMFAPLKKEQQTFTTLRPPEIPPWLACPPQISQQIYHSELNQQQEFGDNNENINSSNPSSLGPHLPPQYIPPASPHISATALLQKAAQMGATMSMSTKTSSLPAMLRPHQSHEPANSKTTIGFGTVNLSSREEMANNGAPLVNGFVGSISSSSPYANKAAVSGTSGPPSILQDMMMTSLSSGFEGPAFEDAFSGIFNTKKEENEFLQTPFPNASSNRVFDGTTANDDAGGSGSGAGGGADRAMTTRDFLGLRPLSQSDIFLNIAGLSNCINASNDNPTTQGSWPHGH